MPSVEDLKACFKSKEKKIPKRMGANTQPCFTPLLTSMSLEISPEI